MQSDQFVIENQILTKYVGQDSIVTIPDDVIEIGENAFENNNFITKVFLPDDCKSIGDHAFYCCMNLIHVRLGIHTETIGCSAFFSCEKLKSVTNTVGLKKIEEKAFHFDSKLVDITLPNIDFCSNSAFMACSDELCREIKYHIKQKNAKHNKYTCKHCGKPLYDQNMITIDASIHLCNECAFVDYDSFIALKEEKFKADRKKYSSTEKKFNITYTLSCILFWIIVVLLRNAFLYSIDMSPLDIEPSLLLLIIVLVGFKLLKKPLRKRFAYTLQSIDDYIASNNIPLGIRDNSQSPYSPTYGDEKLSKDSKTKSALGNTNESASMDAKASAVASVSQRDTKRLYECLANNPSGLNDGDLDYLVSDFLSRAKRIDTNDAGTYEVSFNLKQGVFNGVMVFDNSTKLNSLFKVLNEYNSRLDIEVKSNETLYYYNATVEKKSESNTAINETIKTLERLSSLRANGSISDSEYESLKKGVLK